MLARYSTTPTYNACMCVSYVLSYLSGTPELGVVYSRTKHGLDLHAYSDADWAGDQETRRSTAGYIVFGALGPISWGSKLIKTVCTSSMESEYCAEYYTLQEVLWIRAFVEEMGFPEPGRTAVMMDATAAVAFSEDPIHHSRAKHIAIKYHWIRQVVAKDGGVVRLVYIPTEMMTADPITKPLGADLLLYHRERMLGIYKESGEEAERTAKEWQKERSQIKKRRKR